MIKLVFYFIFTINLFAYNFYLGGGIGLDEFDSLHPRIYILDAEVSKSMKFLDLGFGLSYEGNYSPSPFMKDFPYKSFDAIPFYCVIRVKLPLKNYQPFWFLKMSPFVDILYHADNYLFIHQPFAASFSRMGIGFIKKETMIELSYGAVFPINEVYDETTGNEIDPETIDNGSWSMALTVKKNIN